MPSNHSNTDGNAADRQIINKVENVVDNVIIVEHNKTISGVTVPNNEYMNVDDLLKNEILPVKICLQPMSDSKLMMGQSTKDYC